MHGTKDRRVRVKQSQIFRNEMEDEDKDVKYIEFKDGDHFLSLEKHRIQFLQEVEIFLKKNL